MNGLLLIQLGTPDTSSPKDVGSYLREFLMDPKVIDIPWVLRFILVNLIIVPFRSHKSAEAYSKIWTERGSPLRFISEDFLKGLRAELEMPIALGMRYGKPSLESAIKELQSHGVTDLLIVPLYPQFASASTQSSLDEVKRLLKKLKFSARTKILTSFYKEPEFIEAMTSSLQGKVQDSDHVLMSFHGLPERQLKKADMTLSHCLQKKDCCESPSIAHEHCYRHQSFVTAELMANRLGLKPGQWSVCFQSRLGRTPWLRPFTDEVLQLLPANGKKSISIFCPSFVTDCLETLEEIHIRGSELFKSAGGESFTVAACPNADRQWIKGFAQILRRSLL